MIAIADPAQSVGVLGDFHKQEVRDHARHPPSLGRRRRVATNVADKLVAKIQYGPLFAGIHPRRQRVLPS